MSRLRFQKRLYPPRQKFRHPRPLPHPSLHVGQILRERPPRQLPLHIQQEIADALRKNAYPERTIARVMARLDEAGYINDTDFAEQWAASRTTKGMGARHIRMELRQKGVDSEAIDEALSAIDHDDMLSGALKAARKAASGKNLADPKDRQKIFAALARRGYGYAEARQALEALKDEQE